MVSVDALLQGNGLDFICEGVEVYGSFFHGYFSILVDGCEGVEEPFFVVSFWEVFTSVSTATFCTF